MLFRSFEKKIMYGPTDRHPLLEMQGRTKKCSIASKNCSINARNRYHFGNKTRCSKEARVMRIGHRARYRDHKSFTLFLAYFHTLNATDFACSALYCFLLYMNQTYGAPLKGSLNRIFRKMMKNS